MSSIEKQSLEAHVDLCAERYQRLQEDLVRIDERMDEVESMVRIIMDKLTEKETTLTRTLIRVGFSLIITLIGTVGGLFWYIFTNAI